MKKKKKEDKPPRSGQPLFKGHRPFPQSVPFSEVPLHTYIAVLYTHFWLCTMFWPFTILYDELVFDKCVLKSTMRVCKVIDGYAQHDRHDWRTVMNGMYDGEVLLHLLICFSRPVLTCTCMYETHTGYSWSFTITCSSRFLCRDYYYLKPVALWSYTPGHLH